MKNNPLNLEIGKEYLLNYKYTNQNSLIRITRFTDSGYPWGVGNDGSGGGIITDSYILIKEINKEINKKNYIKDLSINDKSELIEICKITSNNRNVDLLEKWLQNKNIL